MLMKLLMIDQCITQGGSEGGGGQVRQHRFKKKKHHEQRAVWELRERGTEKCQKMQVALLLGNESGIAG